MEEASPSNTRISLEPEAPNGEEDERVQLTPRGFWNQALAVRPPSLKLGPVIGKKCHPTKRQQHSSPKAPEERALESGMVTGLDGEPAKWALGKVWQPMVLQPIGSPTPPTQD
jgi:hypothetical protein